MAQPHGRSHHSHTYDITGIHHIDEATRTITVTTVSSVTPVTTSFALPDDTSKVSLQLFRAAVDSLAVRGEGGNWESVKTLQVGSYLVRQLSVELRSLGVVNVADPSVNLAVLREAVGRFNGSEKRTLNKLLQRAIRDAGHPDPRLPSRLMNTKMQAEDHERETPHSDSEIDAFEYAARAVLTDAIRLQRDLFAELGYATDARAWMQVPAEDVMQAARARDEKRDEAHRLAGARPPRAGAPRIDHIDWCLLNPRATAQMTGLHLKGPYAKVIHALHPPDEVLVSGLILQVLTDNTGVNVSTLLQQTSTSLQPLGEHTGQLEFAKARNHTAGTRVVTFDGFFSTGGIVQLMTALTRFSRDWRSAELKRLDIYDANAIIADRIYVKHVADVRKAQVLTSSQQHNGYRKSSRFTTARDEKWPEGVEHGLRWRALRKAALRRGLTFDADHDVVDHSRGTRVEYLANCLPDAELAVLGAEAQDAIHSEALGKFEKPEVAARLARAKADGQLMEIGPSVCANNGNDPDDSTRPCSLGLAACFVCPSGYRTLDHAPGLLALQEYTDIVGKHDPKEWVEGEAGVLHYYATETLKRFPQGVVDKARTTMDRDGEMLNIHHVYTEMRR